MRRSTEGFTLIELLIVVVLIAILAAIAIPQLFQTKERALVASMRSDLRNLMTAQEAYFVDFQTYTPNIAVLAPSLVRNSPNVTLTINSATATGWDATATHSSTPRTCSIIVAANQAGNPTCP